MTEPEMLSFLGGVILVHQRKQDSEQGLSILEHRIAAGFAPPRHIHYEEEEIFHVLEGELELELSGRVSRAGRGDTVRLPSGYEHGFKVVSPGGARILTMTSGQFEAMVRAASMPAADGERPRLLDPSPEQQRALAEVCSQHGIDLVGPPMA